MADPLPHESGGSVKDGRLTFGPSGKRGRHQRTFGARLLRRREAQAGRENMRSGMDRDTERAAEKGPGEEGKGDEQARLEEASEEEEAPAVVAAAGRNEAEEDDEEEDEEEEEEKEARLE